MEFHFRNAFTNSELSELQLDQHCQNVQIKVGHLFPIREEVVESLSPSLSLSLSEIVVMGRNDDGYEVDFDTQSWVEDTAIGYKMKPKLIPIL